MEFNFFLFSLRISEALLIWPKRKSWEELNKCHGMNSVVLKHAPLSMEFSRQEYWSGLPFPSPGDLPWTRDQTLVSCITGRFFTIWATREAQTISANHLKVVQFSSVHSLSRVQLFVTPWISARQASLSITNSRSLLKLMSIKSVMPSSHLILCRPLLLPPISPSIRVFSNESTLTSVQFLYAWSALPL